MKWKCDAVSDGAQSWGETYGFGGDVGERARTLVRQLLEKMCCGPRNQWWFRPAERTGGRSISVPAANTRAVQVTGSRRVNRTSDGDDEVESVRIKPGELAESMRATVARQPATANLLHSRAK